MPGGGLLGRSVRRPRYILRMSDAAGSAASAPLPRNFHRFLVVRLAGTAANQMLLVALGWQMYDLTADAWDLGLVGLLQFVPALLLTIPAGLLVDRVDRRAVLVASLLLQTLVAGALASASALDTVGRELILVLSVVIGVARALQMPAQQALAPMLVPAGALPRALATSSSVMQIAVIGGPALGGFLYALADVVTYAMSCVLLVVAMAATARIRLERRGPPGRAPVSLQSVFAGLGFIRRHPVVLGAMSLDLFAVLLGGATALLPIFAKDVLDTGAWGLGLLRGAPGLRRLHDGCAAGAPCPCAGGWGTGCSAPWRSMASRCSGSRCPRSSSCRSPRSRSVAPRTWSAS